jgi:hypothetical protein
MQYTCRLAQGVMVMASWEKNRANLERAWIRQLAWEWRAINEERLGGVLRLPVFALLQGKSRLGLWEAHLRTLSISTNHIWEDVWDEVVDTLRHEMAHQLVSEVYKETGQSSHGDAFKKAAERLGVGETPEKGHSGEARETQAIVRKIHKLFALASSKNVHEAEAAMATANTLLLKYNLAEVAEGGPSRYLSQRLGLSAAAIPLHWKLVGSILNRFFFVECIWVSTYKAKKGRAERLLEVSGTPENVQMAEYVHEFLHNSAEHLWGEARKTHGGKRRREYLSGVLYGFEEKLESEKIKNKEVGLVWIGDKGLNSYFSGKYGRISRLVGRGSRVGSAHQAGKEAGKRLKLQRPVGSKSTFSTPKLLD